MSENNEVVVGDFKISESVLNKMIRESAAAIEGVSSIKDVTVKPADEALSVELMLVMDHKMVYPEVGQNVQTAVAADVERMTGIKVAEVSVMVERLDFSRE